MFPYSGLILIMYDEVLMSVNIQTLSIGTFCHGLIVLLQWKTQNEIALCLIFLKNEERSNCK